MQTKKQHPKANASKATVEVIQFHFEHRCMTCNKIEKLARQTLKRFSKIAFYISKCR